MLLGAAESSLDIAGSALLPGAWPILKGAIEPVLERLKERLNGVDPTSTPEVAQEAIAVFDADPLLQETMRSRLLEQLNTIASTQKEINADVRTLMTFASGNQRLLEKIVGDTEAIARTLDDGVKISEESMEAIRQTIRQEAAVSGQFRAMALREIGPIAELLERQVGRLQIRAVELVQEGAPDRAFNELKEGLLLVATLLKDAPTDRQLRLHLGFIHKTLAQVFDSVGQVEQSRTHIQQAEEIFRLIHEELGHD